MKQMPDNSIDSIVTDPPYGLSKEPDITEVLTKWINGEEYAHNGSGFMGREWDQFVPSPTIWKECFRVLKPGGHLLAFGGTRTFDLVSIGLRLAGFERRETLFWCFGSGFPKSRDISKEIDKLLGEEREVVATTIGKGGQNLNTISRVGKNDAIDAKGSGAFGIGAKQINIEIPVTAPSSDLAKKFDGYGTALKPSYEPILLCRKPLEKGLTIAENVVKWGTGGININGCRIELQEFGEDSRLGGKGTWKTENAGWVVDGTTNRIDVGSSELGRFPANLILDDSDEVKEAFSIYSETKSGKGINEQEAYNSGTSMFFNGITTKNNQYGDFGNVSRFFYCAKADKEDRNEGLSGFEEKMTSHDGRETLIENPFQRNLSSINKNTHPTVKPLNLMRYLVRLITPPDGIVLDPFAGSGSTGKASILEGFDFIGSDMEEEYVDISNARIQHAIENKEALLEKYDKKLPKVYRKQDKKFKTDIF
jgi:site-specific DNA-methyltransferase (adenine-specific)